MPLLSGKDQFVYLTREGGGVGEATTVVGGAYVCNKFYSCLSDCIKRKSDRTNNIYVG